MTTEDVPVSGCRCGEATKQSATVGDKKNPTKTCQKKHAQKQLKEIARHLLVPSHMHRIGLLRKSNPFKVKSVGQTSANYPF